MSRLGAAAFAFYATLIAAVLILLVLAAAIAGTHPKDGDVEQAPLVEKRDD